MSVCVASLSVVCTLPAGSQRLMRWCVTTDSFRTQFVSRHNVMSQVTRRTRRRVNMRLTTPRSVYMTAHSAAERIHQRVNCIRVWRLICSKTVSVVPQTISQFYKDVHHRSVVRRKKISSRPSSFYSVGLSCEVISHGTRRVIKWMKYTNICDCKK